MANRFVLAALLAVVSGGSAFAQEKPRLVLQITVDQLRGDLIDRFNAAATEGGFRYLLENGKVFTDAHHRHANTETIVGHTTLATGADPAVHGMIANLWYDRKANAQFYNVQDPDFPLVGAAGVDANAEIDPTQRAATTDGRSPRNILTSTIADEIAVHFGDEAKIFGVSVKDRGAIAMAGHAGQAYWFSKAEGRFVTSTFYRDDYPSWISQWETKGVVGSYAQTQWQISGAPDSYLFGDKDDQPWETDFPGFGRVFPHDFGSSDSKYYTTLLTLSPAGDEITADFAKTLLTEEGLGQDDVPDFLSISFSSTDYVGHIFGPSSLEAEDNLRRLDKTLNDLFAYVDEAVGLDNTLVVLSADHGAPEAPGYLKTVGIQAKSFLFDAADTSEGFARLKDRFGIGEELVSSFTNPYVYLNQDAISAAGADRDEVEAAVAAELRNMAGIAFAVTSSALRRGEVPDTRVSQAVLANFHPDRSGDIYVVFEPHWFVADFDGLTVASAHGSPWTYDTYVPVMFVGPNIEAGRVARRIHTVDVAPTIAAYLGAKPPTGATGIPLPEVFD